MATVNKDFKIKQGLIVEGTTATVNNYDVLTKKPADQTYIIGLIGGAATPDNTPDTVVLRDENGDFAAGVITADIVGDVTGNADTATALETSRTITLGGDLSGSVSFNGSEDVTLTATVAGSFATDAEVATAKSEAIADAATYTDGRETAITTAYQSYADTAETDAIASANSYTDGRETAITTAYQAYADQAEVDAKAYTDTREGAITTAYQAYADQAETDAIASAQSYTNTAVAGLVDSAPELLDTLNELAAAIGDNPDFIGTVTAAIGEKVAKAGDTMSGDLSMGTNKITSVGAPTANGDAANKLYVDTEVANAISTSTYTAGTNIDITGNVVSVTGLDSGDISDFNTAALSATSAAYDVAGAAATAESNANDYTDTAISGVNTTIDNLTTDDVAEGTAEYFTDAKAKTSAADLLTGATLANITITGTGAGLTITAENGVADSTTADLAEDPSATGSSGTMYFTDARAVSALEAVVPNFTAIEIDEIAKHVATEASIVTASTNNAVVWAQADYKTAEFLVNINDGTDTQVSKVILTLDASDNVAITEYAIVGTASGSLGSASATVTGSTVALTVTTVNNNSDVRVVGTLLK